MHSMNNILAPEGVMIKSAIPNERIFLGHILDHGLLPKNCLLGLSLIPYDSITRIANDTLSWIVTQIVQEFYPN